MKEEIIIDLNGYGSNAIDIYIYESIKFHLRFYSHSEITS
jgi:hypothetical protein